MANRVKEKKPSVVYSHGELSIEAIKTATGSDDPATQARLINQAIKSLWLHDRMSNEELDYHVRGAIGMLNGIKPMGELEGMLAVQMVGAHSAAMDCLRRAMLPNQPTPVVDQYLRHAAKLLSIFSRQMEVLNKHRGKAQQKVTVEHVNVEAGAKGVDDQIGTQRPTATANVKAENGNQSASYDGPGKMNGQHVEKLN